MTKKDRVALVISVVYLFFPLLLLADRGVRNLPPALLFTIPIVIYWGYRFIKNDISFLNKNNSED